MSVIDTNQLKSALERLCLVVPMRATLPVLENLRWRTEKVPYLYTFIPLSRTKSSSRLLYE
jgi:hypothetical protein